MFVKTTSRRDFAVSEILASFYTPEKIMPLVGSWIGNGRFRKSRGRRLEEVGIRRRRRIKS